MYKICRVCLTLRLASTTADRLVDRVKLMVAPLTECENRDHRDVIEKAAIFTLQT